MSTSQDSIHKSLELLLNNCRQARILTADGPTSVVALQGDASDRRFFRVRQGSRHYVGLVSPRKKRSTLDENDSYFSIGRHLARHKLPVPGMLWADPEQGHFLLEDLGDYHLQRHARRAPVDLACLYRNAVRVLAKLHCSAPLGFDKGFCFDGHIYSPSFVYERELQYFVNSFLNGYLNMAIAEEDLRSDFENLAEAAGVHQTTWVMHRDFQSRNIMLHHQSLWILDFQGMRYGPPAYDLAALLLDPYVSLSSDLRKHLFQYYWSGVRNFMGCSLRQFRSSYDATRLCRNLQVLGAYGYLGVGRGKKQFLQYIPRAWHELCVWLQSNAKGSYPQLERCVLSADRHHRDGCLSIRSVR